MEYFQFIEILEDNGFGKERCQILKNLSVNYNRFKSVFTPYSPSVKILQNLLTSGNSRFGNALLDIVNLSFKNTDLIVYDKPVNPKTNKVVNISHLIRKESTFLFIKQKLSDDHDSNARKGIIENFDSSSKILKKLYPDNIIGILYFMDPIKKRNEKYFKKELRKLSNTYKITFYLFYGDMLYKYLGIENKWVDIINYFQKRQEEGSHFPNINFDENPKISFEELKSMDPKIWKSLLQNQEIWKENLLKIVFPKGTTLRLLLDYFSEIKEKMYDDITLLIRIILEHNYSQIE